MRRNTHTTILLTTQRLHPRDRAVLAIVVVSLTLFAAGLAVGHRPAEPQVAPRIAAQPIIVVWTVTPVQTATAAPTAAPVVIFQTVEVPIDRPVYIQSAPQAEPAPESASPALPEPTATPLPPLLVGERLAEYFVRTGITPEMAR